MTEQLSKIDFDNPVIHTILNRRVTREFNDNTVPDEYLLTLLEAARWAPTGGGRRVIEYVVIKDEGNIRKIRAVSPGILNFPKAILVMLINHDKESAIAFDDSEQGSSFVDIGTAMENILLTAHVINLGACPIMSFHSGAIRVLLNLPEYVQPVLMVILGFPLIQANPEKKKRLHLSKINEITNWEEYGQQHAEK